MRWRKKSVIAGLALLLVLLVSAGGTLAYLTIRTETADNTFQFPAAGVDIVEEFNGWDIKQVQIKNSSEYVPGVARVLLLPRVQDAEGNYVQASLGALQAPEGIAMTMGDFTFELADNWKDNWFYQDGFFYCRTVLEPGETSHILLEKVRLTSDTPEMREKYKDYTVKADVQADILQAEGGAPEAEWDVTVSGNTVSGRE